MQNNAIVNRMRNYIVFDKAANVLLRQVNQLYEHMSYQTDRSDRINDFYVELSNDNQAPEKLKELLSDYATLRPNVTNFVIPIIETLEMMDSIFATNEDNPVNEVTKALYIECLASIFMTRDPKTRTLTRGIRWNPSSKDSIYSLWEHINDFLEGLMRYIIFEDCEILDHNEFIGIMNKLIGDDSKS
jgi:hypothetical protein